MQTEAAGVAEGVEHASAGASVRHGNAIVALIEVVAGLLPFGQMHENAQAVLGDLDRLGRRDAAQGAVVQFQAFELADAAFGAQIDAGGLQQFGQQIGEHLAA